MVGPLCILAPHVRRTGNGCGRHERIAQKRVAVGAMHDDGDEEDREVQAGKFGRAVRRVARSPAKQKACSWSIALDARPEDKKLAQIEGSDPRGTANRASPDWVLEFIVPASRTMPEHR